MGLNVDTYTTNCYSSSEGLDLYKIQGADLERYSQKPEDLQLLTDAMYRLNCDVKAAIDSKVGVVGDFLSSMTLAEDDIYILNDLVTISNSFRMPRFYGKDEEISFERALRDNVKGSAEVGQKIVDMLVPCILNGEISESAVLIVNEMVQALVRNGLLEGFSQKIKESNYNFYATSFVKSFKLLRENKEILGISDYFEVSEEA